MNIQNNPSPNFKAIISDKLKSRLYKQLYSYPNLEKNKKLLETNLLNIKKWGDSDTEIVVTKNKCGNFSLGLRVAITPFLKLTRQIERLKGITELSQFIRLKERDILQAENTIYYLYKKYGKGVFQEITI